MKNNQLPFRRTCYQLGNVELQSRARGPAVWLYRWRVTINQNGSAKRVRRSVILGTKAQLPKAADASRAADAYRIAANPDLPLRIETTFGAVLDRYIAEEMPQRRTTRTHYMPWITNHIRPKWDSYLLADIRPFAAEEWLKSLHLAIKSKQHVRSLMAVIFDCAMRWDLAPLGENPMRFVRIKNGSESDRVRYKLSPQQVTALLAELHEPYRTMAVIALCLGLRAAEIAGLQWADVEWAESAIYVQREYVLGNETEVKTRKSKRRLPLSPQLAEVLREHQKRADVCSAWIFVNADTGLPLSMNHAQGRVLAPSGKAVGIGKGLGWHSLRHTYSTMLRYLKVDIKVQQEMMRHADIRLTLNNYTDAVPSDMHDAGQRVANMVLA